VQRVPSVLTATLPWSPAEASFQSVSIPICIGYKTLLLLVPLPVCPSKLLPQAQSVPSDLIATLCSLPADICSQPVSVLICTGVCFSVVVPSPIYPWSFLPQAQSVPSWLT